MNNNTFKTRFYNQIELKEGNIYKKSSIERLKKEFSWFETAKGFIPNNIPEILLFDETEVFIKMEYINGKNLYETLKDNRDISFHLEILHKLKALMIDEVHKHKKMSEDNNIISDIEEMYFEKPLKGLNFFFEHYSKLISKHDRHIRINNKDCVNPFITLEEIFQRLKGKLAETKYCFIHGDFTLSNIVIDSKNNLYLIDPRGGFGNTILFGDPNYDITKLFYSLIGNFDSLNNHNFKYYKYQNEFFYDIENITYDFMSSKFLELFNIDKDILNFIHSTIWLSLIPHLEEDVNQTTTAFLNGTILINKFL